MAMQRTTRAANVASAVEALPALAARALEHERMFGETDPRTLSAWASVEAQGATVHRQSRILAGKPRGG